jgi:hypothetical protein
MPSTVALRFEFNAITLVWMLAMTDSQSGEVVRKSISGCSPLREIWACISRANGLTGSFDQLPQSLSVIFSSQPSMAHTAMTSSPQWLYCKALRPVNVLFEIQAKVRHPTDHSDYDGRQGGGQLPLARCGLD